MPKPMIWRVLSAVLLAGAFAGEPAAAFAQGNSLFKGSGLSSSGTGGISGTLGATGFGGMGTSGRSGGTGGGGGGAAGFLGALGGGGAGLGGAGGSGLGGGSTGGVAGNLGGGNTGFAGRNSAGCAGNAGAGQTGGANRGGATRNFNRGNNSSANNQRNSELGGGKDRKTSAVRPRQKVAFEYNIKSNETVAATITTRLDRITSKNPEFKSLKGVSVAVEGDQLVLLGSVQTAEQSRIAENLLRLEPGVRSVRNELRIEQPVEVTE